MGWSPRLLAHGRCRETPPSKPKRPADPRTNQGLDDPRNDEGLEVITTLGGEVAYGFDIQTCSKKAGPEEKTAKDCADGCSANDCEP